jgi:NADH-quinone oxidoreductase subunit A
MTPEVNPLTHSFVPVAFMVFMSVMTGLGMLVLSWFLGQGRSSHADETIYECGLDPMDAQNKRFPVKFYVVAMLFILFDVEIALLIPWAVYFGAKGATPDMRLVAFVDLLVFAAILVAGYVYLYKAGAFDWVEQARGQRRGASAEPARQRAA